MKKLYNFVERHIKEDLNEQRDICQVHDRKFQYQSILVVKEEKSSSVGWLYCQQTLKAGSSPLVDVPTETEGVLEEKALKEEVMVEATGVL